MIDAILYKEYGTAYPSSIGERPARYIKLDDDAQPEPVIAPWVRMDETELRARIAATDQAWEDYRKSQPAEKMPVDPVYARSPDGTRWMIVVSDTGAVSARRA